MEKSILQDSQYSVCIQTYMCWVYVKNQITCHLYRSTVSGKCWSHIWTPVVHTVVKEHTLRLLHKHLLYMQHRLQKSVEKVSIKTLKATQELNLRITEDPIYTNLFLGFKTCVTNEASVYIHVFKKASKWSLDLIVWVCF